MIQQSGRFMMRRRRSPLCVLCMTAMLVLGACGTWIGNPDKGKDDGKTVADNSDPNTPSGLSLASMPNSEAFIKSSNSTVALTAGLALYEPDDSFNLTTGTPPNFVDVAADLATYLTGDTSALVTAIQADQKSKAWADMKDKLGTFFDAEVKCGVMEHTARIVERLKMNSAPLCLLQAIGSVGDKVFKVDSGEPIADLTKVFSQASGDKVLQIGRQNDARQTHYEMVQITGNATNEGVYHVVYTTCLTSTKKAFLQHTIDVDRTTLAVTFQSLGNGAIDDRGVKPNGSFSLSGYLAAGDQGFLPDVTKARQISYSESGTMSGGNGIAQAALTLDGNAMSASFFATDTSTDRNNQTFQRTDKTMLDVQYTGSGISDLVIYQGAGRSLMDFAGQAQNGGAATANSSERTVGFDFDNTSLPRYATTTSSSYLTAVAAIDTAIDAVLKQTKPTAPDMTAIDSSACEATPTTVLVYVDRPEDNSTYSKAKASCNTTPAQRTAQVCDALRDVERTINDAMNDRRQATGNATN